MMSVRPVAGVPIGVNQEIVAESLNKILALENGGLSRFEGNQADSGRLGETYMLANPGTFTLILIHIENIVDGKY